MPGERSPLWSRLPPVADPTPEQLAEVRGAIRERARRRAVRRSRLRLVPGLMLMLGMGLFWWMSVSRTPPPRSAEMSALVGRAASVTPDSSSARPPAPSPEVPPPPPAAAVPARARPATRVAHGVAAIDDPETALLGKALTRLRHDHDPQGALTLLESYRREFPAGTLRPEAMLVRAESLARLGRHQELVDLLAPETISDLPRSTELRLLRAEALARLDRCPQAVLVFDELLGPSAASAQPVEARLRERALYGRALCRAQGGELDAARGDLEREEEEFPEQAAKAHQTLESLQAR